MPAAKLIGGLRREAEAKKGIRELEKTPFPETEVSPELRASQIRAEGLATEGFSAEETAAFQQGQSRLGAARFRRATDVGGGEFSQAIAAGIGYGDIGANLDFAASGAQLKRITPIKSSVI